MNWAKAAIARRTNRSEQLEKSLAGKRKAAAAKEPQRQNRTQGIGFAPPINLLPPTRTAPTGGGQE